MMLMKIFRFLIVFLSINGDVYSQINIPNFVHHYVEDIIYYVGYNNQLYECDTYNKIYRNITALCYMDSNGYLRINYKKAETSYFILKEEPHYLILSPKQLFIFDSETWINGFSSFNEYERYQNTFIDTIKSNVFLTENGLKYSPENLLKRFFSTDREFPYDYWSKTLPLAINREQMNIFEMEIHFQGDVEGILLLNGFVDFYRPHLYKNNSRIKQIKIIDINNQFERDYLLEDKIQFQEIIFPVASKSIRIKILSAYTGNKYTDICCSSIIPIFNESMLKTARISRDLDYNNFIREMINNYKEIK